MTAREYLGQLKKTKALIGAKIEQIAEFREMATNISGAPLDGAKVQSSKPSSRLEEYVCKYVDLENEAREDIAQLTEKRLEILHTIEKLPFAEYDLLHKHYFQGIPLCDIEVMYQRSKSWVMQVHARALRMVQDILDQ